MTNRALEEWRRDPGWNKVDWAAFNEDLNRMKFTDAAKLARLLNLKFLKMEKLYLRRRAFAIAAMWRHARGILKHTLQGG